jgi:phage terminase small subunit
MKVKPATKKEYRLLTPQQERFCHEYIKDYNGTQSAIRAKYSPHTARRQATRLLSKDHVWYKVRILLEEQFKRLKVNADMVLKGLSGIAWADLRNLYDEEGNLRPVQDWPEHLAQAISSIETEEIFEGYGKNRKRIGQTKKIKLFNKNEALRDLGRHLKMFTDVQEIRDLENLAEDIKQARVRAKHAGTTRRKSRD